MARRINPDIFGKVLQQHNGNFSAVARRIGVTRASLYRVVEGKYEPGGDFIEKFKLAFPDISLDDAFIMERV